MRAWRPVEPITVDSNDLKPNNPLRLTDEPKWLHSLGR
jgi:hypothetical protein